MKKILITGSIAYDILLGADTSFTDGMDLSGDNVTAVFLASRFARHHGGTGANIAWGMMLLGGDPVLVSTVGSDGGEYVALLEDRGIDTTYIEKRSDAVTATAIIGTDSRGSQLGFFHAGADALGTLPTFAPSESSVGKFDLSAVQDTIAYAIISPRDERAMLEAIRFCRSAGIRYFFDPGQRISSMSTDDLRRSVEGAYGLIANAYEWENIRSRLDLSEESIHARIPVLVVTQGEKGALLIDQDGRHDIPGCTADRVVNPTGAGDALRAGFLHGLASGWSHGDALRLGCAMGSFTVETEGTLPDTLDLDILRSRAEAAYGEPLPL